MADNDQAQGGAASSLADRAAEIRKRLDDAMTGQNPTPTERALKDAVDGILDALRDLNGVDGGYDDGQF